MTRRISLLLALSVMFVLVSSGVAFAIQGDSTYLNRASLAGASPHGGYLQTTQKCAVCHAVHNAAAGGEALLRSPRTDACVYCHITGGVSTLIVYGGVEGNYSGSDSPKGHNYFSGAGVQCTTCHQVHAATDLMTANVALSKKLLIKGLVDVGTGYSDYDQDSNWPTYGAPQVGDAKPVAMSKWCTKCHKYWPVGLEGFNDSHVLTASNGTTSFAGSQYCQSCHNSNTVGGVVPLASAFPHYTDGARFLTQAATNAGSDTGANPAGNGTNDGVCLRCHRDGITSGVGLTF
jgi:predicted CXXCH cytochrome family protein